MLPKKQRLTTAEVNTVRTSGKSSKGALLRAVTVSAPHFKVSVVVPKAVRKSAVERNALRRRVYAALQESAPPSRTIHLLLFVLPMAKSSKPSVADFKKDITTLFKRI